MRDGVAVPARSAGDDGDLSGEWLIHVLCLVLFDRADLRARRALRVERVAEPLPGQPAGQLDADGAEVPEELPDFNAAGTTGYEDISSVECSDDGKTFTTTYANPYADWKGLFGGLIPAHVVENTSGVADITTIDPAATSADSEAAGEVWSTGFSGFDPAMALSGAWYSIDSFTAGQNLILKRNDAFYGTPGTLDEIVFLQVPDATAQPAALENGDVQVISPQPNADLVAQLADIAGVTTSVEQGLTFEHYDFNQANPHLAKLEVRQALALCIDREEIVTTLVTPINPDATVLNNHIYVPSAADYQDNSGGLARDVDAAKAKLRHLRPERLGDRALPFPVAREGGDVFPAEGMGHVEDGVLLLTQGEVHLSSHSRRGHELNAC